MGKPVVKLVDEVQEAGEHKVEFVRPNLRNGIYFYHISLQNENRYYDATKSLDQLRNPNADK